MKKQNNLVSGKKNTELIKRIDVNGSPFTIIEQNKKFILTLGKYKLTIEEFDEIADVYEWIDNNHWNLTLTIIGIVNEFQNKNNE